MTDESDRRAFLGTVAATITTTGVTGCLGGGDGGTPTDETDGEMSGNDAMDDSMTATESMDGMSESEGMDDAMETTESEMAKTESETMGTDSKMMETETESGTMESRTFEVTVENVSEKGTITTDDGEDVAVPLSPTAYAVHSSDATVFTEGEAASDGLQALAEDGKPGTLVSTVEMRDGVAAVGAAKTPEGADSAGSLGPGDSYAFEVEAGHSDRLTLATMFVQSNDLFYAPDPAGIALFDDGDPVDGTVTDRLTIWDAGTEQNQEPGAGPDQAPRQSGTDTGPAEDATVRPIGEVDEGYDYPDVSEVIKVSVTPT